MHFLSKQTGKGSRHGVKQSFPRHPHTMKSKNEQKKESDVRVSLIILGKRFLYIAFLIMLILGRHGKG